MLLASIIDVIQNSNIVITDRSVVFKEVEDEL